MKNFEIQKKEVKVLSDVICDCCGKSCKNTTTNDFEYLALKGRFGYGTKKDMEEWTAQICEECLDTKLNFINFKVEEMNYQTVISTDSEHEEVLDDILLKRKEN